MQVQPIASPANGEGVVAVRPVMAPSADAGWHHRLNVFTGRALTAPALSGEQVGRQGRLAATGQKLSPGVVKGLQVSVENQTPPVFVHLSPGLGLAATGEDVVVPRLVRVSLDDVPVYPQGVTLGDLRRNAAATPPTATLPPLAAVLVLQPVVAAFVGQFDNTNPCEQDPSANAFEDWQLADACRMLLYSWPSDWLALPPDSAATWRNVLANAIFEAERQLGPPPWQAIGVPVALIAFTPDLTRPRFIDRHAVVRAGGKGRTRTPLIASAGTPFLWRARLQQFAEQVAQPDVSPATIGDLGKQFRFVPPAGLLPKQAFQRGSTAGTWATTFFPRAYRIQAMPVPLEQLDLVLDASAPLAPFDATSTSEDVRILVPVTQPWFDQKLLMTEAINPALQQAVTDTSVARGVSLQRQNIVRAWASNVMKAITGLATVYPNPDPGQLDANETPGQGALNPAENPPTVTNPATGKVVDVTVPLADLKTLLTSGSPLSADDVSRLDSMGLDRFIVDLRSRVDSTNDTLDLGFVRIQTDVYRHRQLILDNASASRLATSPALALIAQGETAAATQQALNDFITQARTVQVAPIADLTTTATATTATATTAASVAAAPPASASSTVPATAFSVSGQPHSMFLSGELISAQPASLEAATVAETAAPALLAASSIGVTRAARPILFDGGADGVTIAGADAAFTRPTRQPGAVVSTPVELLPPPPTAVDVRQQAPIVGQSLLFQQVNPQTQRIRTVTVAERLKTPAAPEAKSYAVASKAQIIGNLSSVRINVDDLQVPGFLDQPGNPAANETTATFASIKSNSMLRDILAGRHDPDPTLSGGHTADEASWLSAGVRTLEHSIAALRLVEGRVQAYQRAIHACELTAAALTDTASRLDHRLKVIGDELGVNRHNVATAQALLNDETDRVNGVNQQRTRIFNEHVPFIAFLRPRTVNSLLHAPSVPVHVLDPSVVPAAVPDCLAHNETVPNEIRAMVDLMRDAPLSWFPGLPPWLERIDELETLRGTLLLGAKQRAIARLGGVSFALPLAAPSAKLAAGIASAYTAQQRIISQFRVQTSQLDLSDFDGLSWRGVRDQAQHVVSVGDLIDVSHGRSEVSQAVTNELDNIARAATCLFNRLHAVTPSTRLVWAERLSQYDGPIDLRSLTQLPSWGSVDYLHRHEMQDLADWLYQQVDPGQPAAVSMMHDIVRVCVLLASHAPVDQIVAGHVQRPTTVKPGGWIHLTVDDFSRVRIGMQVAMYRQNASDAVAYGVVEDLGDGMATARVVKSATDSISLDETARVRFLQPNAFTSGMVRTVSP